jgi:DNA-binding protein HU-beta
MNKADLVDELASKVNLPKSKTEAVLNAFMKTVVDQVKKGDKVLLVGFGTFERKERKATTGVNPQTKQKISIPAKKAMRLKVSSSVQKEINS